MGRQVSQQVVMQEESRIQVTLPRMIIEGSILDSVNQSRIRTGKRKRRRREDVVELVHRIIGVVKKNI